MAFDWSWTISEDGTIHTPNGPLHARWDGPATIREHRALAWKQKLWDTDPRAQGDDVKAHREECEPETTAIQKMAAEITPHFSAAIGGGVNGAMLQRVLKEPVSCACGHPVPGRHHM